MNDIIVKLNEFCIKYSLDGLFLIGDICLQNRLKQPLPIKELNVICAFPDQTEILGKLFATEFLYHIPKVVNNSVIINMGSYNIIFTSQSKHSYVSNERFISFLQKKSIENVPLMHVVCSQDFTICTLLTDLRTLDLIDPTDRAIVDIERKNIKTLLPAAMLAEFYPAFLLDGLNYAVNLNFYIDPEICAVDKNGGFLKLQRTIKSDLVDNNVLQLLKKDLDKTVETLKDMELLQLLDLPRSKEYLTHHRIGLNEKHI